MYGQNKTGDGTGQPQMSHAALAYLNSLKEASKAIHGEKPGIGKSAPSETRPTDSRRESLPISRKSTVSERKSSVRDQEPHRRASISSVVSDIWERKGKLSKETTLSEMNIREADELSEIFSDADFSVSDVSSSEQQDNETPEHAKASSSGKTIRQQQRKQSDYSDGASLIPYAKDAQKSGKKKSIAEAPVATVDELATSHPAPGTIGRRSTGGLSVEHSRAIQKSIEKSIFGTSPRQNMNNGTQKRPKSRSSSRKVSVQSTTSSLSTTKDLEQLQMLEDHSAPEQTPVMKQSPFKKASVLISGSSSPSALNSAESVAEEITEVQREEVDNYSTDSFGESTSTKSISSSSSKTVKPTANALKMDDQKVEIKKTLKSPVTPDSGSGISSSDRSSSRTTSALSDKHPEIIRTSTQESKVVQESESEKGSFRSVSNSSNERASSLETPIEDHRSLQSVTVKERGLGSTKARNLNLERISAEGKRKYKPSEKDRRRSYREHRAWSKTSPKSPEQKKYSNLLTESEKSGSRSDNYSLNSRRSQKSSSRRYGLNASSRSMSSLSSFMDSEYSNRGSVGLQDSEHVQYSRRSEDVKYANLLAEFEKLFLKFVKNSGKIKENGKGRRIDVAVQTIELDADMRKSPIFTPLLLRDIEENMKTMDEKEAFSSIIQTHVELIKKQAKREEQALQEWDSAIGDLEQRCEVVTFDRLKKLLHGNSNHYFDFL